MVVGEKTFDSYSANATDEKWVIDLIAKNMRLELCWPWTAKL